MIKFDHTAWWVALGVVAGAGAFWWWNYLRRGQLVIRTWEFWGQEHPHELTAQDYPSAVQLALTQMSERDGQRLRHYRVQVAERLDVHRLVVVHEWELDPETRAWVHKSSGHPMDGQLPPQLQKLAPAVLSPLSGVIDVVGEVVG